MSISGTHTFDNQINYYIGYPLKNIKKEKMDPDASFGAIRPSDRGEMTLFLIVKGTTDNFTITYDTKKVKEKIISDIKKEKDELIQLFKKKDDDKINTQQTQQQSDRPRRFNGVGQECATGSTDSARRTAGTTTTGPTAAAATSAAVATTASLQSESRSSLKTDVRNRWNVGTERPADTDSRREIGRESADQL